MDEYIIDCTGNVCKGDEIKFEKAIFTGRYPNSKFIHVETIYGTIINDSYGKSKQQHTFTIKLLNGEKLHIKGRNLYRNKCFRKSWTNEEDRKKVLKEKYSRGNIAREKREERKLRQEYTDLNE